MKRFLAILFLSMASYALADEITMIPDGSAGGTQGVSNGSSQVFDLSGFNKAGVQIRAATTSVCSVIIKVRNLPTDPFAEVGRLDNPDADEPLFLGPGIGDVQVTIENYVSGTITVTLQRVK